MNTTASCFQFTWIPDFDSDNVDNTTNECGDSKDIPCFGWKVTSPTEPNDELLEAWKDDDKYTCERAPGETCVKVGDCIFLIYDCQYFRSFFQYVRYNRDKEGTADYITRFCGKGTSILLKILSWYNECTSYLHWVTGSQLSILLFFNQVFVCFLYNLSLSSLDELSALFLDLIGYLFCVLKRHHKRRVYRSILILFYVFRRGWQRWWGCCEQRVSPWRQCCCWNRCWSLLLQHTPILQQRSWPQSWKDCSIWSLISDYTQITAVMLYKKVLLTNEVVKNWKRENFLEEDKNLSNAVLDELQCDEMRVHFKMSWKLIAYWRNLLSCGCFMNWV